MYEVIFIRFQEGGRPDCTEDEVRELFEQYGAVRQFYFYWTDGYAAMEEHAAFQAIEALEGMEFHGGVLHLHLIEKTMPPQCLVPFRWGIIRVSEMPLHYTQDRGETTLCGLTRAELPTPRFGGTDRFSWSIHEYASKYYEPVNRCLECVALLPDARREQHFYQRFLRSENPQEQLARKIEEARALRQQIDDTLSGLKKTTARMERSLQELEWLMRLLEEEA
jgi:hypothetical protein